MAYKKFISSCHISEFNKSLLCVNMNLKCQVLHGMRAYFFWKQIAVTSKQKFMVFAMEKGSTMSSKIYGIAIISRSLLSLSRFRHIPLLDFNIKSKDLHLAYFPDLAS